jgi:hypothetical protein
MEAKKGWRRGVGAGGRKGAPGYDSGDDIDEAERRRKELEMREAELENIGFASSRSKKPLQRSLAPSKKLDKKYEDFEYNFMASIRKVIIMAFFVLIILILIMMRE